MFPISPQRGISSAYLLLFAALLAGAASAQNAASRPGAPTVKVDYNRDIRPILSAKCFHCHGPDPKSRQANLRFDLRADATKMLMSSHRAIVPGKPQQSELVKRIALKSGPLLMPPASVHKPLNAEEKRLLTQWVLQGAEYKEHWAFVPPKRPPLPKVANKSWPRNGIDYFVLARLEQEGLKPAPETDQRTLIRRVSLDLTGIPPTSQETEAFLRDKSPNAYEKVVDRLLASPRYGEQMAMRWMDGARYADSNGYQADYERFQWRWRDWVIDAYNRNLPFDKFTIEQIAGDLLPNATMEQKIATGFNRNHRINTEGGIIAEEWRVETIIDRVETTSAVWLGLTMGCGRCHEHKYDPISHKEFYQFYAYFNNVPESGIGEERPVNHPPVLKAPTKEQQQRLAELEASQKRLDTALNARLEANRDAASRWMIEEKPGADAALWNGLAARYVLTAQPHVVSGNVPAPKFVGNVKTEAGRSTGAVVTDGSSHVDLGSAGDFDTKQAFSYGAWVNPVNGNGAVLAKMESAPVNRGWDMYLIGGRPAVHIINTWPGNALKIIGNNGLPNNQWSHVFVTYDGSAKPEGMKLYVNGQSVPFDVEVNALSETIRNGVSAKIGMRSGEGGFAGKVDDVALYNRVLTAEEVLKLADADPAKMLLAIAPDKRTEEQKRELTRLWSARNDTEYGKLAMERETVAKEQQALDGQITTVMVMDEMPKPRDCYVLVRGQYDHRGEQVTAALPAAFGSLPKGAPNNRLGLAMWIASPNNPLTARVAVNRFWEKFFGIGLVATSEDFGTRAEFPSHPELLDWLATEFVRLKWDMKALQKLIVMSATYRQASRMNPELVKRDPENRLLARGPRFRLPAETIRDQALAVSGLLVEKLGGPSVRPYQPDGVWDEINVYGNLRNYKHDKNPEGLYRRSLYTFWKRTSGPPTPSLFDVPGREMCRVRRSRTNTPLQALALMNEITYVESARVLAQKMLQEGGSSPEQHIVYGFRRAVGRSPLPQEIKVLASGLQKRLVKYRANADAAQKLVRVGEYPRDPKLDTAELAAYTMTASVLLNLDETITKE